MLFDAADIGHARAMVKSGGEIIQVFGRADRVDFDAAIREVARPAGEAERAGFVLDKEAEADALHAAADQPALGGFAGHIETLWYGPVCSMCLSHW